MPEHLIRKRWIKLWTQETLQGTTTKELSYDETGTWFLLLCKAGDSPIPGTVCISEDLGYLPEQLATLFRMPLDIYLRVEGKLINHNKISKNGNNIIKIINWDKYQGFDKNAYQREYMADKRMLDKQQSNNKKSNKLDKNVRQNVRRQTRQDKTR